GDGQRGFGVRAGASGPGRGDRQSTDRDGTRGAGTGGAAARLVAALPRVAGGAAVPAGQPAARDLRAGAAQGGRRDGVAAAAAFAQATRLSVHATAVSMPLVSMKEITSSRPRRVFR